MKISVIIPSYKPQAYLKECLISLCNQTISKEDFEIVLILNGCKEPFHSQILDFISKHKNVNWNYIHTDMSGVSNARNIGLDNSKGDYIAFVDDDDYVSPSYLEELYNKSDENTIALSNAFAFNDDEPNVQIPYIISDAFEKNSKGGKISANSVRSFFSSPCMKMISRKMIDSRRFDSRFKNGEDSLFMFLISDKVKFVDFTSAEAVYYRRYRQNSAVTAKKSKRYILTNRLRLIFEYTKIYLSIPFKYSFKSYLRAVAGSFHHILKNW